MKHVIKLRYELIKGGTSLLLALEKGCMLQVTSEVYGVRTICLYYKSKMLFHITQKCMSCILLQCTVEKTLGHL